MKILMKDHADKSWLAVGKTEPKAKNKMAIALTIIGLILIIAMQFPRAAAEQDMLVGPEMQSYIETYHVTVDEYGVE